MNGDGALDLVAGPLWFAGPEFTQEHHYRPGEGTGPNGSKHSSFLSWVRNMNGDGRMDIFQVAHTGKFHLDLYLQPEQPSEDWPMHRVVEGIGNESPEFADLDGDGKPEMVAMKDGAFGFFEPDWTAAEKPWTFHAISIQRTKSPYYHGLGIGDVTGDGDGAITWRRHGLMPTDGKPGVGGIAFTQTHALEMGDFNGDGLTDFVTGKRYWAHNGRDSGAEVGGEAGVGRCSGPPTAGSTQCFRYAGGGEGGHYGRASATGERTRRPFLVGISRCAPPGRSAWGRRDHRGRGR